MSIVQKYIVNTGHGGLKPSLFAIHSTANPGATARNHLSLWSRGYDSAVHLVSDWNEAFQAVEFNRLCWHVGRGNSVSIGIEICEATNYQDFVRGIKIAAQAVREVLAQLGWGADRLRSHAWFSQNYGGSDHSDPISYFTKWGYSWDAFVNEVKTGSGSIPAQTATGEDFLMALSQYDQELTRNAVVDINNRTDRIEKAVADVARRLGPINEQFPFDYLPAILGNLNSLFALVGEKTSPQLSDDQLGSLADSLKKGLGDQVVKTLADKLSK